MNYFCRTFKPNKKSGFTLIELILTIIILAIIASVTLPKFSSFKKSAKDKSEDAVYAAMRAAIDTIHLSYVVQGKEDSWPNQCPLLLLAQAPPNKSAWAFPAGTNDNVNWQYWTNGVYHWYIYCPHWSGPATGGSSPGRRYDYSGGSPDVVGPGITYSAGTFFLNTFYSQGH